MIEDEALLLGGLKESFGAKGFEVITAMECEAGMSLAFSSEPNLVLLDLMLPKINGYEVCREIRAAGLDMPIIMLKHGDASENRGR